jgi:hypothetical protein
LCAQGEQVGQCGTSLSTDDVTTGVTFTQFNAQADYNIYVEELVTVAGQNLTSNSNMISTKTQGYALSAPQFSASDITVPNSTSITVQNWSQGQITPPPTAGTGTPQYTIYLCANGETQGNCTTIPSQTTTSASSGVTFSGLDPTGSYSVYITENVSIGSQNLSSSTNPITVLMRQPPDITTAEKLSGSKGYLVWKSATPTANVDYYTVQLNSYTYPAHITGNSFTTSGLTNNQPYCATVIAHYADGSSESSSSVTLSANNALQGC